MLWPYYDLAQGGRYVAGRDDFTFPRLILTQRVAKKLGFRVKTNRAMLVDSKTNCKHILIDRNMPLEGCICVANTFFNRIRRHTDYFFTPETKLGLYNMITIALNLQKFVFWSPLRKKVASTLQNRQNCLKIGLILTFDNCYVTSFT